MNALKSQIRCTNCGSTWDSRSELELMHNEDNELVRCCGRCCTDDFLIFEPDFDELASRAVRPNNTIGILKR